jgi:FdhD protein
VSEDKAQARGLRRVRVERPSGRLEDDVVAVEEPLEIRVQGEPVVVTMRTPVDDVELAAGFLFSEGLIGSRSDLSRIECARADDRDETAEGERLRGDGGNVLEVELTSAGQRRYAERRREARAFPATSACGVCGKPSLRDLWQRVPRLEPLAAGDEAALAATVQRLPERMRRAQALFDRTGGIHAAALFDLEGRLIDLREDVGRHNAVDKIVGAALLAERLPLHQTILLASGRAGYEIVQKALTAAIPVVAAVGAASSLALDVAEWGGMRLFSFVGRETASRHVFRTRSSSPAERHPGGCGTPGGS